MTPQEERQQASEIDVEAGKQRVQQILKPNGGAQAEKPAKKPRSDKGTHRPKPAAEGRLSWEQIERLDELIAAREEAKIAYLRAQEAYFAYLQEITAK